MNSRFLANLADATRLTREGRVSEALAEIRKVLGNAGPGAEGDASPPSSRPSARTAFNPFAMPAAPSADRAKGFAENITIPGLAGLTPGRVAPDVPSGARYEERAFAGAGGQRKYKLYVPSGYVGKALPLVVMLHGCTQSPDDFAVGTRMNEVAEEHGFLVAYPEQTKAANASRCWNWFKGSEQRRGQGEPALIAGITRQVMTEFSVSEGRVYVAGLSAGGAAAAIMGSLYPELYAAVGVHSGLACGAARDLPSALTAMRSGGSPSASATDKTPPTIVFHGDHDKTVHPVNGAQVITQAMPDARLQGALQRGETPSGVRYTRHVHSDGGGVPVLEHWVIHGLGHVWSGGSPAGSYTDARGPDASREMIRFFLHHRTGTL